jgi:hypothetical protein
MFVTKKIIFLCISLTCSILSAADFTISSYNCGGLSAHYDYLRAASMQKLMQERYSAEPEEMAFAEKIQKLALKLLFSTDAAEIHAAQAEWEQKGCQTILQSLFSSPADPGSPNRKWNEKIEGMITSYKIRPVSIYDTEVNQLLEDHLQDLSHGKAEKQAELLRSGRSIMAQRIFSNFLKFDIICLQEADYLDPGHLPESYEVHFGESSHSRNGIAWKKERFELQEIIGEIAGRAFAVRLLEKETGRSVLVASAHLTGCNPFFVEKDEAGDQDSARGDGEMGAIIDTFNAREGDLLLLGMDSNVTSLHPRLKLLKEADYALDHENYLEPTCTNPYQVLDTRIDWIALKSNLRMPVKIQNIPILSIGLNNISTNMSDHKPIAAKITF